MSAFLIKTDDVRLQGKIRKILDGLVDASYLMKQWGDFLHASVALNFDVGGRPRWKRLSAVTIKKKGHDRPLIGRTGNLANIVVQPGRVSVKLGTQPAARAYASIHQYGGRAGRNLKVLIPARPYMMLQRADEVEIKATTMRYLKRLAT